MRFAHGPSLSAFMIAMLWMADPAMSLAPRLAAQSPEVQEGNGRERLSVKSAIMGFLALNTPMDSAGFAEDTTVRKVIGAIYVQLAETKCETSWLVTFTPNIKGRPEFNFMDAKLKLVGLPKTVTPGRLLKEIVAQTKSLDLIVVIRPGDYFEITSSTKVSRQHCVRVFWWVPIAFADVW